MTASFCFIARFWGSLLEFSMVFRQIYCIMARIKFVRRGIVANQNRNTERVTRRHQHQRMKKDGRKVVWGTVGGIVVLVLLVVVFGMHYIRSAEQPLNPNSHQQIEVKVPVGSSPKQIGALLEKKHVIKSGFVFNRYTRKHNMGNFKAGYYEFTPAMTLNQIAKSLERGGNSHPLAGRVLVREGATIDEIGNVIQARTHYSKQDFLNLMQNKAFIKSLAKKYPQLLGSAMSAKHVRYRLEGYLYPATYYAGKHTTLKQLVEQMVAKENQEMNPYYDEIKHRGWTVQETLALAALVQGEGGSADVQAKIAGVFENRLDKNMKIQSDVSIQYALNKHHKNISYKDLQVNSPYNLYQHTGVGPGPVNNPSIIAVQAVLHPKDRDQGYLYFVANMKTGKVYFTRTYSAHQQNVNKVDSDNN